MPLTFLLSYRKRLSAAFESNRLSIPEKCLLTAQIFGDSYETAFWRLAANRLLLHEECDGATKSGHLKRRFGLADLVWDELTEREPYRATVVERVNRLMHEASTPEQNKLCTQFLLLLGGFSEMPFFLPALLFSILGGSTLACH